MRGLISSSLTFRKIKALHVRGDLWGHILYLLNIIKVNSTSGGHLNQDSDTLIIGGSDYGGATNSQGSSSAVQFSRPRDRKSTIFLIIQEAITSSLCEILQF